MLLLFGCSISQTFSQLACGVTFGPIPVIIGHWFMRRRSLALGITALGASIGGTVLPIAARKLIERVGYAMLLFLFPSYQLAVDDKVSVGNANACLHFAFRSKHIKLGTDPLYLYG